MCRATSACALLCVADGVQAAQASVDYWWPRVASSFGHDLSDKFDALAAFGLRHRTNGDLRRDWQCEAGQILATAGLSAPSETPGAL